MVRRLRLCSGLVLFAYVTTHLANHSLGLISLDAMEGVQQTLVLVIAWFHGCMGVHFWLRLKYHVIFAFQHDG